MFNNYNHNEGHFKTITRSDRCIYIYLKKLTVINAEGQKRHEEYNWNNERAGIGEAASM